MTDILVFLFVCVSFHFIFKKGATFVAPYSETLSRYL